MRELISVQPTETVANAFKKMKELHITQLPVMDDEKNAGSITEYRILQLLLDDSANRDEEIGKVMGKPFPFVELHFSATEISKFISKENTAVLVKSNSGALNIITEFDLIEAMA